MYLKLTNAGFAGPAVDIPMLGFGVYKVSSDEAQVAMPTALSCGYRHIDTAHLYGNEAEVGKAVRESGIPREDIFVTTKLWNSDHGYEKTLRAFDDSLKQLGLDYVDLYLVHSPLAKNERLDTWRAMETILKSGKARSIGVSNYGIHHLKELLVNCEIRPSCNQVELHPFNTRTELVGFCEKEKIAMQAYSPLTRGERLGDSRLAGIAKSYKKSPAQVLIRWALQKGYVVLPKSATPKRIIENAQVFDFEISEKDMTNLDSMNENLSTTWDPTKAP